MSPEEIIQKLSPFVTCERLEKFYKVAARRTNQLTIILENLYQEHNISAILRTCDCLGIRDVHVVERNNSFKINEEVALGASQWLNLFRYSTDNLPDHYSDPIEFCCEGLKQQGYLLAATIPDRHALNVYECPIQQPIALLLGTEIHGLTDSALRRADIKLFFPMRGFTDSFNVSVSAALFLNTLMRKMEENGNLVFLNQKEQEQLIAEWLLRTVKYAHAILKR